MLGYLVNANYCDEENDYQIEYIEDDIEIDMLADLELEKRLVKKIRSNSALLSELFIPDTEYIYKYPPRTRMEVEGGAKIALRRGARLNETKIYNLVCRFKNKRQDNSKALAFMYRPLSNNDEWVVLQADNTELTLELEKFEFGSYADDYYGMGRIDRSQKMSIEENMEKLNIHERCAQSLMHEFGHVLHWRMFDHELNSSDPADIYLWFLENDYTSNVDARNPKYYHASAQKKLHFLKESLVEDYRIYLNIMAESGMFILPNKYNFAGDFCEPELLKEGMMIMQQMLKPVLDKNSLFRKSSNASRDDMDVVAMREIHESSLQEDWVPGKRRMSANDHLAVYTSLLQKQTSTASR
ncbi:hypothetical protein [Paenibacillus sp. sgz500992]|uniref:hypothetical protein n=1 Tax=Paenibacillus sp. sgz500992 TaxID=3242476 RepID=UPI0036D3E0B7